MPSCFNRSRLTEAYERQGGICHYCARAMSLARNTKASATLDHKTPKARGGTNERSNLVAACYRCNNLKGAMTVEEFRAAFPVPDSIPAFHAKRRPIVLPPETAEASNAKAKLARARAKEALRKAERAIIDDPSGSWSRRDRAGFDPVVMGLAATPILTLADLWPAP